MTLPDYYNRVNADFLRLIPPDANVVLDASCGAGAFSGAYRRINPRVSYLGVACGAWIIGRATNRGPPAFRRCARACGNRMLANHFRARHRWYCAMLRAGTRARLSFMQRTPENTFNRGVIQIES